MVLFYQRDYRYEFTQVSIYEGLRNPRWSQFASEIYKVDTIVQCTYTVSTWIEYISGTKFTIITIFYNVYSKYNIPRKGQRKSTRDYRSLTNLRFSFARHQQSLLTHFPVKFIVIQNKSAVSKHWISVANAEC